jgi:hypothetical protein
VIAAILIDTHPFFWARVAPERLTTGERRALDEARACYVGAVSLWEIAILMALDRIGRDRASWPFLTVSICFRCCPTLQGAGCPAASASRSVRLYADCAGARRALALLTRNRAIIAY